MNCWGKMQPIKSHYVQYIVNYTQFWRINNKMYNFKAKIYLVDLPNSLHLSHPSKQIAPIWEKHKNLPAGLALLNLCSNSISEWY